VAIEVGLYPSTAVIRRGCRLRIDVQPYTPAGLPVRTYDEGYHVGATNTVYNRARSSQFRAVADRAGASRLRIGARPPDVSREERYDPRKSCLRTIQV